MRADKLSQVIPIDSFNTHHRQATPAAMQPLPTLNQPTKRPRARMPLKNTSFPYQSSSSMPTPKQSPCHSQHAKFSMTRMTLMQHPTRPLLLPRAPRRQYQRLAPSRGQPDPRRTPTTPVLPTSVRLQLNFPCCFLFDALPLQLPSRSYSRPFLCTSCTFPQPTHTACSEPAVEHHGGLSSCKRCNGAHRWHRLTRGWT